MYHGPGAPLSAAVALGGYALAVACFFSIGLWLGDGRVTEVAAQVVALAGVPVLLLRLHGGGRADLGLVAPPLLTVIGAALAGTGTWLVALHLARPVVEATDAGRSMHALSRQLLAGDVAYVLVARALVPAVCEELLHRGLVLGALAPRLGRVSALVVVTALFAALHLEPARMVSAAAVGLVAGALALWSRSVVPAITVHAVNNGVALALGLGLIPSVSVAIARHPDGALAVAAALVVVGCALAWLGRQRM